MPNRIIAFGEEAREKIARGVEKIARAVGSTMGPKGHAVAIDTKDWQPTFTVDGVTVANHVELSDPMERLAADAVRTASRKTNDVAGDGTTTAAVLAHAIYSEGVRRIKNGENATDVKVAIDKETLQAVDLLRAEALPCDSLENLTQVATISAKDQQIGRLVAEVASAVGSEGMISVEIAPIFGTESETTKGFKLDTGFVAPWMVTNAERNNTEWQDVDVLVTDGIVGIEIGQVMKRLKEAGKNRLVVVADGFNSEALGLMAVNGQKSIFMAVGIRIAGIGDSRKKESLRDLCAALGATLISEETGRTVKDAGNDVLGHVRHVIVNNYDSLFVDGKGTQEEIDKRVAVIRAEMETEKSEYNLTKLKERLSRLMGVAGVIRVGGTNEQEAKERKQRVEDAVNAVRSAMSEGTVTGGGIALLHASMHMNVLQKPLREPLRRIAENAGLNPDIILAESMKLTPDEGVDMATGKVENLRAVGIIDPLKVTRTALENAASVAGLLLLTDTIIVDEPVK